MIRTLRMKLIGISLLSLCIVFFVILAAIGVISYRNVVAEADSTLAILAENGGAFPKQWDHGGDGLMEMHPKRQKDFSPELPYESRYFSVLFDENGQVILVDTGKISAVDTGTAIEFATAVQQKGSQRGFLHDYRYVVQEDAGGDTRVIFLDCGRSLGSFRSFVFISIGVFCAGVLAVLVLIVVWSGYVVRPIAQSYEKQKRFITDAGHEIKTPLTIIDADAEVLSMDLGENEWLADIQAQTKRLAELTNDLILLSRLEEEQAPMQRIAFPLSEVVEEVARSFQSRAKTQNKEFTIQVQPLLSLTGDEKSIRQLVSILLDNALKYSQEGGTIRLTLDKTAKSARLSVYNTTPSIEKDQLPHLFDRFYRTDRSRNSQTGGYGLGLSIAAAVVSAHKGKISASSEDGHSLRITAVLPLS